MCAVPCTVCIFTYGALSLVMPVSKVERRLACAVNTACTNTSHPFLPTSRLATLRVPGMGNTSGPCASSHASASCPGLQPLRSASAATASTSGRLEDRASKRGAALRLWGSEGKTGIVGGGKRQGG